MIPKELNLPLPELNHLADGLANTFLQRRDIYARQLEDGRYTCIIKPLTMGHIQAHLQGSLTLGVYALDRESQAGFLAFDADDDSQIGQLIVMARDLARQDVTTYLEGSRRGGHLWLFFAHPIPGKAVREFGTGLTEKFSLHGMEMFPKQDRLQSGPGSLIRLPFGIHRRTGQRYSFYTANLEPIAATLSGQIQILSAPKTVSPTVFEEYRSLRSIPNLPSQNIAVSSSVLEGGTLSERIKNSVSVLDFIGQYVKLSPAGRGLCPFHEDHHPSFAVNTEENYWHCFAGCGGGSIIDFWMKWQKVDFTTALRELAGMLF